MKLRRVATEEVPDPSDAIGGRSAADRVHAVVVLAAPYAQNAAGRVIPIARAASGRAVPLVQSAAGHVVPLSREAARRVSPYGRQAAVLLVPYAQQATGRIAPLAQTARQRGRATVAAARGELSLPEVAESSTSSWAPRLAAFAGAAGVGVLLVKKLMGAKNAKATTATATIDEVAGSPAPAGDHLPMATTDPTPPPAVPTSAATNESLKIDEATVPEDLAADTADAEKPKL